MWSAESIVSLAERLPAAKVQVDGAATEARIRVGARVVARVDLRGPGRVLVELPADRIPLLREGFPSCRPSAGGIVFDLADPRGRSEAVAAIRGRVNAERLAWQLQVSSP